MKRLQFKLIPFIISVLIIVVSVTGICLYAYKGYDTNKIRFVNSYFNYEDHSAQSTEEQIKNYTKFSSAYYSVPADEFKFTDVKSGFEYNETASQNSKNFIDGATYANGVLHLEGWFDIAPYAVTTYNSDTQDWVYSYYFYVYNVNYKYASLINNLYFCFVDGIGGDEDNFVGTYKLNAVIEEFKEDKYPGANGTNLPTYTYNGKNASSYAMYIYDLNATGSFAEKDDKVYRLISLSETLSTSDKETLTESRWLYQMKNATFSIFYSGEESSSSISPENLIEIVRGTYTSKYEKGSDFNAAASVKDSGVYEGYAEDLNKAGYGKFIFTRILITGLITFAISGVLAVLFYLIWQDSPEEAEERKQYKLEKKKRKQRKADN